MFENFDFDYIMDSLLSKVDDKYDKRVGSVIYDMLAPAAAELENLYVNLDMIMEEGFADTASYEYLVKRAAERSVYPIEATYAVCKLITTPSTVEVEVGEQFTIDDAVYTVTEKTSDGVYKVTCSEPGIEGNSHLGETFPVGYIEGLETAEITEVINPAIDDEDEESLRNRYFTSLTTDAFGGNVADYKKKVKENSSIGAVKVIRAWNGGGTVKLILLDSSFNTANSELVNTVQNSIDPNSGDGTGVAPIGHIVSVTNAVETYVDVTTTITYSDNITFSDLESQIKSAIDTYLLELRKTWEDASTITVRISQIESRLLNITGIDDITDTKINGSTSNMIISDNSIPVRGEVVG